MRLAQQRRILSGLRLTRVRELRVGVRELPVIEFRRERDRASRVVRDLHAVMRDVGGARRNQTDVLHAARLPGVPLVDRVALPVQLQRAIEMRAALDGPRPRPRPGRSRTSLAHRHPAPGARARRRTRRPSRRERNGRSCGFAPRRRRGSCFLGRRIGCALSIGAATWPTSRITIGPCCSALRRRRSRS